MTRSATTVVPARPTAPPPAPRRPRCQAARISQPTLDALASVLAAHPGATDAEIVRRLKQERGVSVGRSTVHFRRTTPVTDRARIGPACYPHADRIKALWAANPHARLADVRRMVGEATGDFPSLETCSKYRRGIVTAPAPIVRHRPPSLEEIRARAAEIKAVNFAVWEGRASWLDDGWLGVVSRRAKGRGRAGASKGGKP